MIDGCTKITIGGKKFIKIIKKCREAFDFINEVSEAMSEDEGAMHVHCELQSDKISITGEEYISYPPCDEEEIIDSFANVISELLEEFDQMTDGEMEDYMDLIEELDSSLAIDCLEWESIVVDEAPADDTVMHCTRTKAIYQDGEFDYVEEPFDCSVG